MKKFVLYTRNKYGNLLFISRRHGKPGRLTPYGVEAESIIDAALFDSRIEAFDCARDNDYEHLDVGEVNFSAEVVL